jgi:hypothetical protein
MKSNLFRVKKVASVGSAVALVTAGAENRTTRQDKIVSDAPSICASQEIQIRSKEQSEASASTAHSIILPIRDFENWDDRAQARYHELAIREAYETITADEQHELETLESLREQQLAPASYEEIVRAIEAKRRTAELISALSRYVTLYDPTFSPDRPKA